MYFEIVLSLTVTGKIQVLKTQDSEDTARVTQFKCRVSVAVKLI